MSVESMAKKRPRFEIQVGTFWCEGHGDICPRLGSHHGFCERYLKEHLASLPIEKLVEEVYRSLRRSGSRDAAGARLRLGISRRG